MPTGLTSPVHLLIIMVVAMVVLGPEKLPQAMRQVGRFVAEVRRWSSAVSVDLQDVLSLDTESNTPPSAVATTPTNGQAHALSVASFTGVPARATPSAPLALGPGGEWGELGLSIEETGSHATRPAGDDSSIPSALREGGEWSDPR